MIKRLLRSALLRFLDRRGLSVVPKRDLPTLEAALAKWRAADIRTVIDIGASDGRWSAEAMRHFPAASYFLIEAQAQPHEAALRKFQQAHTNVAFVIAAAGNRDGHINFCADQPLGGVASEEPFAENNITVPVTRVDTLVQARGLQPPFLVKLDTHGFEVPILEGAAETLKQTRVLIVEAYNFTLCPGCLRFHELCAYLEARGFRCFDLFDILHRPKDDALWQADLLFAPASLAAFASSDYS